MSKSIGRRIPGLYYNRSYISMRDREEILSWLATVYPIWEMRYSKHNPPPEGEENRMLLRPVYWLGSWQFACLNYYHPPKGIQNRCVQAEPFPPVLQRIIARVESMVRKMFHGSDLPKGWKLNTCLLNFYGDRVDNGKRIDTARVGEHKDFEPGPVASLSLGERALFQFVTSQKLGQKSSVVSQQWLDDGSLQIFGGHHWKSRVFHRVQRVDRRDEHKFSVNVDHFETRRLNFTFRYVPEQHVVRFCALPREAKSDVKEYMEKLAINSEFFRREIAKDQR